MREAGEAHELGIKETYEVNLHSDTGKLARREGYGKGDGPWWEFLPRLFSLVVLKLAQRLCYNKP